jgi:hypothetical protein
MQGETDRVTWNSLAALLAITSVVTTAVSVSLSVYLLRGSPQNINTQTVNVEQPDTLGDLIKREMDRDGVRIGVGRISTGNRRPDSE